MSGSAYIDSLLNRAIAEHYEDIKAAVRGRGFSSVAAADVVHDLYVKLAENPEALLKARSLRAFLARAAINLGIDRARRAQYEQRLFSGADVEALRVVSDAPAPDHALEMASRLAILRDAILDMPERRRAVFVLHRLHGMKVDAIARRLRISRNMTDRHLRRAMVHCLERLSEIE